MSLISMSPGSDETQSGSTIVDVELFEAVIPFVDASDGYEVPANRWDQFDVVLVRVTTADGVSGWGECFSFNCRRVVVAAFEDLVQPLLIGQDADDVPGLMRRVQLALHLFGRYGITLFAISGIDIALWDRKARAAGVPLYELLGELRRTEVEAYASLIHYQDPALIEKLTRQAVAEGFQSIKLHETTAEAIEAGRAGAGEGIELSVDANCAMSREYTSEVLAATRDADVAWLEEPLFPPEDFAALAELAEVERIPVSVGENASTRYDFIKLMDMAPALIPQPSVIKVGGVTEFMAILDEANKRHITCKPHSPYFGPGYWATLQIIATMPGNPRLEYNYVDPEAFTGVNPPLPQGGIVQIPQGLGIGFEPNWDALRNYAPKSMKTGNEVASE